MKIMFAIKSLGSVAGGAERVLCMVSSELVSRGHDVSITTFDNQGCSQFYFLDKRVTRLNMGLGNTSRSTQIVEFIAKVIALRRLANREKPDVVVAFMHSMFIPLAFSLIGSGIPLLGSEHTTPEHYRSKRFQFLLFMLATLLLDRLTVVSEVIRLKYPKIVRNRMVVMPNPVQKAIDAKGSAAERCDMTILCVGRLEKEKDHETLIRAFSIVERDFPHWSLKIIGEGTLRDSLKLLIDAFCLNDRVSMPGVKMDVAREYESADIFVTTSRYEAFGLATAEAMSYGLPVIGFADCSGTNELIVPGKTGILLEPGFDRAGVLASSLVCLMSNKYLRECFGTAGREEIKNKFSIKQVGGLWEDLLNTVIRTG